MAEKTIYYVAYYDVGMYPQENRKAGTSNLTKSQYTISTLVNAGFGVEVISPAPTGNAKGLYRKHRDQIADKVNLNLFATVGVSSRIGKRVSLFYSLIQVFIYLIYHIEKKDTVILYHSVVSAIPVLIAKFFIRFNLILEYTEMYQYVYNTGHLVSKLEYEIVCRADKYILSTELLKTQIADKPYCLNYGVYHAEPTITEKYNDGRIHIVYAGIINKDKGAHTIVHVARYLDQAYAIHVVGYGEEREIATLLTLISEVKPLTGCEIIYDGLLRGKDYISYLQKCHIGVCTQDPEALFTTTSFPSKILSYLSNGLCILSTRIPSLEISKIASFINFYNGDDPKAIAVEIQRMDPLNTSSGSKCLKELDRQYILDLQELIICGA